MKLSKEQIYYGLENLIEEGNKVLNTKWSPADHGVISVSTYVNYDRYVSWRIKILNFLSVFMPLENLYVSEIKKLEKNNYAYAQTCVGLLEDLKEQIEKGYITLTPKPNNDISTILNTVFSRFHRVARQLRTRYNNRATLEIEDEYDVQDLLYALLQLFFDDVRKEEWTPSYAGSSSRQDFLLKTEKIVIEIKKTRATMKDKDLGEQLIIDIEKYQSHPDCERLICFVYDPEGRLENPQGIMNDLNTKHDGFAEIIIKPE